MEESKPDISLLPLEETDPSFLFLHTLLHNPASDNVCPRGTATSMGCVLRPCTDVLLERNTSTTLIPIPDPVLAL